MSIMPYIHISYKALEALDIPLYYPNIEEGITIYTNPTPEQVEIEARLIYALAELDSALVAYTRSL